MVYKYNCEICGKEVVRTSYKSSMRFCSKRCMWKDDRHREKMSIVFKKIQGNPTTAMLEARFKKGHTINNGKNRSPETEFKKGEDNINWKGGTSKKRGFDWDEQRKKALDRDGNLCQRCLCEGIEVHHIVPYSETKNNELDNLITFCKRCHIIHERGYSKLLIDGEDLYLNHVPDKVKESFLELASEEFDGNTGLTLKFLQDFYHGLVPKGWEHLEHAVENLDERLTKLEEKPAVKEEKTMKMGDGKVIALRS